MATGKRREDRIRVVDQAAWVAATLGDQASAWAIANYVSRGALPDGSDKEVPVSEEVEAAAREMMRTGKAII